jgi:hypothetical protein
MTYNVRDVTGFPPPSRHRRVQFSELVAEVDQTVDVPVVYAFGGNAPTAISIGNGNPFEISSINGYARMFVEFNPYSWDTD